MLGFHVMAEQTHVLINYISSFKKKKLIKLLLLIAFAGLISLVYLYLSGPRYGRLIGIDNATSTFTNLTAARVLICTTRKENILSDENSIDHVVVSLSGKVLRELPALASPRGYSTQYAAF
ncbi:hypothetical protein Peur_062020 [Populus x canadensis]|jgi:hypothetical protein